MADRLSSSDQLPSAPDRAFGAPRTDDSSARHSLLSARPASRHEPRSRTPLLPISTNPPPHPPTARHHTPLLLPPPQGPQPSRKHPPRSAATMNSAPPRPQTRSTPPDL